MGFWAYAISSSARGEEKATTKERKGHKGCSVDGLVAQLRAAENFRKPRKPSNIVVRRPEVLCSMRSLRLNCLISWRALPLLQATCLLRYYDPVASLWSKDHAD